MSPFVPLASAGAPRCSVSVIIRAFNEEHNIAAAIESSLAAAAEVGGEVVLADAHSTDRTVEIASNYPIRIVQLLDPGERRSGVTPQLGYQHSRGDYLYLLNADMRMISGFLPRALAFLAQHPEAAGVAGQVVHIDAQAAIHREPARCPRPAGAAKADRLEGGALFRRRAIQESGYLSDRNLHSHEEFDLGVRMRSLGWKLWRIPVDAASRDDKAVAPEQQLADRWRSGAVCGVGELLRAAIARPRLRLVLRGNAELRESLYALAWWCLMLSVAWWPLPASARVGCFAALAALPWLLLLATTRSPARASYSVLSSCVNAAGLLRGLLHRLRPPRDPIASRVLQEPPQASAPRREHYA